MFKVKRRWIYGSVSVVDELDGPTALVSDPDENDAGHVASGQFLVGLVPPHQAYLYMLDYVIDSIA